MNMNYTIDTTEQIQSSMNVTASRLVSTGPKGSGRHPRVFYKINVIPMELSAVAAAWVGEAYR